MPPNIHKEFTPCQRTFLCSIDMRGLKYPQVKNKYSTNFGLFPPSMDGLHEMAKNLKQNIQC